MIINNISPFIVECETRLRVALDKIDQNKSKIVFVTDTKGQLIGSFSDGDFRRWLLDGNEYADDISVEQICNKEAKYVLSNELNLLSSSDFLHGKNLLPIVDEYRRIVGLISETNNSFSIGHHTISSTSEPFVIAEIGNNHQGNMDAAKDLVERARDAGAHCAKFQMRSMDVLYGAATKSKKMAEDLGSQYTLDILQKFQLADTQLFELFDFCAANGLIPLCTPWDINSLEKLEAYGMSAYKVASADFTNYELLERIAKTRKPMICSTGMSTETEILATVNFLESRKANFILLHCNSTYPTPFKDVNLKYLKKLEQLSGRPVGYSGHERGIHVPIAACALGAKVIEKHITQEREQEGPDHKVSLLPGEFKKMCEFITDVQIALGSEFAQRDLTQGELINRQSLAKSIFVNRYIHKGESIKREDLLIRGPGKGLQPNMIDKVVGIRSHRNIEADSELFETDLTTPTIKKDFYQIPRSHGIPVRYHDYYSLTNNIDLDFVEFHFSYRDLELEPHDFLNINKKQNFSVHCPELFANDHLLDLSATDTAYRKQSIIHVNNTIQATLTLKNFFPRTELPTLIVNVGGWNISGFMDLSLKLEKYEILKDSLNQLNLSEINLAIQTMPPFPWHFGGQSHHNLFVCPDEILQFCSDYDSVSICLDTSHSLMACSYYGWNLNEFIRKISPHISYLHIADARGVDGEGVEFGEGDLQLIELWRLLEDLVPEAPFIPEVWQGHVNQGQGFWSALQYIENMLKS